MFNTNVAPRRIMKPAAVDWFCTLCFDHVKKHYPRCPHCGARKVANGKDSNT